MLSQKGFPLQLGLENTDSAFKNWVGLWCYTNHDNYRLK